MASPSERPRYISESLNRNRCEVDALMHGGRAGTAEVHDVQLTKHVIFEDVRYKYADIRRFQSYDYTEDHISMGGMVIFEPRLSLLLKTAPRLERGLVTHIDFRQFDLPEQSLGSLKNMPRWPGLLHPVEFTAYEGEMSKNPRIDAYYEAFYYSRGVLGTDTETEFASYVASESIDAVAYTMQTVGYTALFSHYGLPAE